ncbi:MAG: hypothetical protein WAO98_05600 [Alphaproteobacteria bacterium]
MSHIFESSFKPLSVNQWLEFAAQHEGLNHYPSVIQRPGNLVLMSAVEQHVFPADNKEGFHINILEWGGTHWSVFSSPKEKHDEIDRVARALAMRICKNPPAMLFFGPSAMVLTVPHTASEAEIKTVVKSRGVPATLVDLFSGRETFPGRPEMTHAVENNPALLKTPLRPEETTAVVGRERALIEALGHGVVPSIKDMADFVYGANRVLSPANG